MNIHCVCKGLVIYCGGVGHILGIAELPEFPPLTKNNTTKPSDIEVRILPKEAVPRLSSLHPTLQCSGLLYWFLFRDTE
jgi:hypothetical protein